jgi:hypothetical protein
MRALCLESPSRAVPERSVGEVYEMETFLPSTAVH